MDNLISQNHIIAEQNNCQGEYKPAFMQIRIQNPFDGDLDKLDTQTLGVLIHEYVHFLQNISTPWGLYDSMVRYSIMAETYAYVESTTSAITLPLKFNFSQELENRIKIVENGTGYCPLADTSRIDFEVNRSQKIHIHRKKQKVGNRDLAVVELDICYAEGVRKTIVLGANIIKESMAALYQMLIDKTATHYRYDLPYNLVKILAEQHFPIVASDNVKLIVICYISLFSLSPAEVLINELEYANKHNYLSAIELFEQFVNDSKIKVKEEDISVCSFFDEPNKSFQTSFIQKY